VLNPSTHIGAIFQALFVTFLWSTSWVLIKIGLSSIPALTFAGLRYSLAFVCLLPLLLRPAELSVLRRLPFSAWLRLLALGLLYYTLTQGRYCRLAHLPAVTVSLYYNFSPIFVALLGIPLLLERPSIWQWLGVALSIAGATLYFYPVAPPRGELIGLTAVTIGVIANAGSSILGRQINRGGNISPLGVTAVSMGFGAFILDRPGQEASRRSACLSDHRLAGFGEHRFRLHLVEPHPAHLIGRRIQRDQQHHADPDRHSGLDFPGGALDLARGGRIDRFRIRSAHSAAEVPFPRFLLAPQTQALNSPHLACSKLI
jgi:uncharacterized membrane protein